MSMALHVLLRDIKYGVRALRRNFGFFLVALLTLALGIGANTTIFSVVNIVLLKALPYPNADRLVILDEYRLQHGSRTVSWLDFLDWRRQNGVFDELAAYRLSHVSLTGKEEPTLLRVAEVSSPFFSLLGVKPLHGRIFDDHDDTANANPVAVLSYSLWRDRMGSNPHFAGKALTLDGVSYSVIGVLPPGFNFFGRRVDAHLPIGLHGSDVEWNQRSTHPQLLVLGRLPAGVSIDSGRTAMNVIMHRLEQNYPQSNTGLVATVTDLYQYHYGGTQKVLLTLFISVGCILLIACVNVANLLLARAASRKKEVAVRAAMGASRWRLVRQLLTESVVLSLLGGVLGTGVAFAGLHIIIATAPQDIPQLTASRIDTPVLLFTLAMSLLTGLVFGVGPAMRATGGDINSALIYTGRGVGSGRAAKKIRSALLVCEMAIALVLVTATGLMLRSMINVVHVDPGFRVDHLLALDLSIPPAKYAGASEKSVLLVQAVQRLRGLPGVRAAGAALCPPLVGVCSDSSFMLADRPVKSVVDLPTAASNITVPGYFEAMQVPLIQGSFFTDADNEHSRLVAIINHSFARRYWPNESAVGKRVREGGPQGGQPYREIVGVVADVRQDGMDSEPRPEVFLPATQFPLAPWTPLQAMTFVVRTEGDPMGIADSAKNQIQGSDKDLPVTAVRPMAQYMSESIARRQFTTFLLAVFAGLALMLSAVGTYGVMAYSVSQRRHEISLRMALGATAARIRDAALREVLSLAFLGIGIGGIGVLVSMRWLASLLFGVKATDPHVFGIVAALLLVVALLASYVPIRRAVGVDPATVLRAE